MNFLSNVLDSIPVVGHVKGVVHYAVGDTDGGNNAMYQSTRTSAVLAGGAVGCLAGPAGAALGGVYGGMITDGLVSAVKEEPVGVFESAKNIGEDIASGKAPLASIGSAGFKIAMDGVGGFGMGGVSSAVSKIPEKAIVKTVESSVKTATAMVGEKAIEKSFQVTAEEITKKVASTVTEKAVKKALETAAINTQVILVTSHVGVNASKKTKEEEEKAENEEREKKRRQRERQREQENREQEQREKEKREKEKKQNNKTGSSGSQPPEGNKNNQNNKEETVTDYFDEFIKTLERLLREIYGNSSHLISNIFKKLSRAQIEYLEKIIKHLMNYGTLDLVVDLVIKLFKYHFPTHVSFPNFLSLLEFVQAYIADAVSARIKVKKQGRRPDFQTNKKETVQALITDRNLVQKLKDLFEKLKAEILRENFGQRKISPDFRNIFSAVYHYFKHKRVPGDGVLTVKDYYDRIRQVLAKMKASPRYDQTLRSRSNATIVCEIHVVIFGRMFRIVVNIRDGEIVLSSAYVVRLMCVGVADGVFTIEITIHEDD